MSNTKNKVRRPGAGRTVGSFSFAKVPLSVLIARLKPEENVWVYAKWAKTREISEAVGQYANDATVALAGTTPDTVVTSTEVTL